MDALATIGPVSPERLYNTVETARMLNVAPSTVVRWRKAGLLPARYPAGRGMRARFMGADIIAARERRA